IYKDIKINIIDTPGHADFGGEVERVLNMADGALLIVDALEGPMAQTKFVLKKALEQGLKIILVINKIDKKEARPEEALKLTEHLFLDLATNDDQLHFPVIYAEGRAGRAYDSLEDWKNRLSQNLAPLLDKIVDYFPGPKVDAEAPFKMLITSLDWDSHLGKHAIGKILSGLVKSQDNLKLFKEGGSEKAQVEKVMVWEGLKKIEVTKAQAGEIVTLAGILKASIGDTLADQSVEFPLPRIKVGEPTLKVTIGANTSPFAGKDGRYVTSRVLGERLLNEMETNIGLKVKQNPNGNDFIVSGRGELHLSVLIETLRREGIELQVSRPEVIYKTIEGRLYEPVEEVQLEIKEEFIGNISQEMGARKAKMIDMRNDGRGNCHLEYKIPVKNFLGFRSQFLTLTKGTGVINSQFGGYEAASDEATKLRNGVLIASDGGIATLNGLEVAQGRGITFIKPGTDVYEGLIVGLNSRNDDIEINVAKEKSMTNVRSGNSAYGITLTPPKIMSLEEA
ncbi:GTP-binding protein, partial [candidate division WWE3 bacterium]|nr:GTP-binding protein [candidate division WWE3 bacterium]